MSGQSPKTGKLNNIIYKNIRTREFYGYVLKHRMLYIMLLPCIVYFIIYRYIPLAGVNIAFREYDITTGILGIGSPWIGFDNFKKLFADPSFMRAFRNTLIYNVYRLIFSFPFPILLALSLNEVKNAVFKRTVQTITYMPHFLSWVVVGGIFLQFFYRSGYFNNAVIYPLFGKKIDIFADEDYFRSILVVTGIWKEAGWGAIIYLAALAGVNVELYESAIIDGANRFKQLIYITIPSIMPVIIIVLILNIGHMADAGFDHVYVFLNPLVYNKGDVLDTYTYRVGLEQLNFSYSTAVGLFKGVVNLILVLGANKIAKSIGHESMF